jgi:hypothetical protein
MRIDEMVSAVFQAPALEVNGKIASHPVAHPESFYVPIRRLGKSWTIKATNLTVDSRTNAIGFYGKLIGGRVIKKV